MPRKKKRYITGLTITFNDPENNADGMRYVFFSDGTVHCRELWPDSVTGYADIDEYWLGEEGNEDVRKFPSPVDKFLYFMTNEEWVTKWINQVQKEANKGKNCQKVSKGDEENKKE